MSIELHCPQCEKLIRAPDDAGGKHGKCPYCKHSVYIPLPSSGDDEIGLAPLDDDEERRAEELRRESISYAATLDKDPAAKGEGGASGAGGAGARSRPEAAETPGEVIDIPAAVERFVLAMRDSKLDEAERIAGRLRRTGTRARDHIEGLMLDQMPPKIKDIPAPLMQGFLKKLLEMLG